MLQLTQIIQKLTKHRAICQCAQCPNTFECNIYDAQKSRVGHICGPCKTRITDMVQITQADLLDVFDYNEHTGELRRKWTTSQGDKGDLATYRHNEGYLQLTIGRKEYLAHRVIWFMKTGHWPIQVDHEDHDRRNNVWKNLRDVPSRTNQMNMGKKRTNTSGATGVRVLPSGKFYAYIMVHRKQISLGSYATLEEAVLARKSAEAQYGFHVNHGN